MGNALYFEWEYKIIEFLQSAGGNIGIAIASLLSEFGGQYILVAIFGFLYWGINKSYGKFLFVNLGPIQIFPPMIKNIVCRLRPYMVHPTVKCLKPLEPEYDLYDIAAQGYSFPSMHSASATAVFGSLPMYDKKIRYEKLLIILAFVIPFLVGVSRVYVGVHYPTDVMFGWVFGAALVFLMSYIQRKVKNHYIIYLAVTLLGLPGMFFCTSNDFFSSYGLIVGGFIGFIIEEKFVQFKNTDKIWLAILRTVIGSGIFLGINTICKLPFSHEFLDSATAAAHIVRTFRYMLCTSVSLGIYPLAFNLEKRIFKSLGD